MGNFLWIKIFREMISVFMGLWNYGEYLSNKIFTSVGVIVRSPIRYRVFLQKTVFPLEIKKCCY